MPTILRESGFRFMIYTDDHAPAHVHAWKDGAEARIAIEDIRILSHTGMRTKDLVQAVRITEENREMFLAEWRKYHG